MPFVNPNSENERRAEQRSKDSGALKSLAKAEQLMQIAFVLPCALLVGWGMGWCVDHFFHTHWGVAVGLVLGIVAGMFSAIRMAIDAMNPPSGGKR